MALLPIGPETRVLVLTGAGISAESGVPTFRGAGGLWEGHPIEEVASPQGFARNPTLVWRFYSLRRAAMSDIVPNAAHHALATLERRLGDRFLLVTQNVDGLHRVAGSERMLELHGNLMTSRCTTCDRAPFPDTTAYADGTLPLCVRCSERDVTALLRPHIVWFGEWLNPAHLAQVETFIGGGGRDLLFIAIGTSGLVYPAARFVEDVRTLGGRTVLVNAERPENAGAFEAVHLGPAGVLLPQLLG